MTETPLSKKFLLIHKPVNWTSFDVVGFIRKNLINNGEPKNIRVGHAGTLDPFATGLLIVGVGREATKRLDEFKNLRKIYIATVRLGAISDTGDLTGKITTTLQHRNTATHFLKKIKPLVNLHSLIFNLFSLKPPTIVKIQKILKKIIGKQKQIPPMYSAKKINGQRLYDLARKGKTVKRQPSEIEIYDIKLLNYSWPNLKIEIICSAGTYIRTLAEDIGAKLKTGAYCQELIRTKIGDYNLNDAVEIKDTASALKNILAP
ncbi:MAG: hypothetical protein A2538_00630 [Candidatus Magasanikbacteria bacterium RIFOXYD2_FULL_41_14]|uniref:tRNA pseudouridine synthase B n=1 Tax=Candidatus Magasanikbacteria bacterium RIFOXYD2_FULL_41_14 TaxID=1798709 RepID=A0A1F6PBP9_9BACT|nr:MAG: hypothetical protein A2538_00630 [Candidatus Magasanikbacteria bacterium RIFOXYD2_FULL_41_14]